MKVTLDLDALLAEGHITHEEHARLLRHAAQSTGSLALGILTGFGVVAVAFAAAALVPHPFVATALGIALLLAGGLVRRRAAAQWRALAAMLLLVGALMAGGGVLVQTEGSLASMLAVAALYGIAGVAAHSALLIACAVLMLSAAVGARTGYFHASYWLGIEAPLLTISLFTALAIACYQLSKQLPPALERLASTAARTSVLVVNFGFWIGSLWGDRGIETGVSMTDEALAGLWALALLATGIWAWRRNRRWVLNTVAVFAGIHFYTQWFEQIGASPGSVLLAGLVTLAVVMGLRVLPSAGRVPPSAGSG